MNCFTISYLLGSGNLRSMAFCSHENSQGGFMLKSFLKETVTHTQTFVSVPAFI